MTPAVGRAPRGTSAPVIRIKSEEFENSIRVEEDSGRFLAAVLENRQQPGGFAPGPLRHPLPRDPDGGVAGRERVSIPIAVRLEGAAIAVELVAVELEINRSASKTASTRCPAIRTFVRGRGRPWSSQKARKPSSNSDRVGPLGASTNGLSRVAPGWRGNLATTSVRASLCMYRERRASRTTLRSAGSSARRHVEHRPGGTRHPDSKVHPHVPAGEGRRSVYADPGAGMIRGAVTSKGTSHGFCQHPKAQRGEMAESRAGATGEDGCRRAGYRQRGYHANRVHAGVDADQSPARTGDRCARLAQGAEVCSRLMAVPAGRDGCDGCVEGPVA